MGREDADGRRSKNAVESMGWKSRLRKSTRNTETVDKPKNKSKTVDKPKNKCKKGAISRSSDYSETACEECGRGDGADKMLLCDTCDKGYHMYCLCPIVVKVPAGKWFCDSCSHKDKVKEFPMVQTKIIDFFRIRRTSETDKSCNEFRKTKRRTASLIIAKKKRRLLPFVPTEDPAKRLKQMGSLATALTSVGVEFSDELTYRPGMAPRSANKATMEKGGMQVMSKEDKVALELCKAMCRRGEWPPLSVVHDRREGFTVEADNNIKDLTIITEYTGDVDYLRKREKDDGDCMMTLLSTGDLSKDLVICPDKRGNIARFINGINNHTAKGKKKQNLKCVRYNVDGESRVLLVAIKDIAKGERLYYDYNGYEKEYPTEHFV